MKITTVFPIATGDHHKDLIDTIRSERCRLLKRMEPKASRAVAADKLRATVLAHIITNSEDTSWHGEIFYVSATLASLCLGVEVENVTIRV